MRGSVTAVKLTGALVVKEGWPLVSAERILRTEIAAAARKEGVTPNWATFESKYIEDSPRSLTGWLVGVVEVYENNREDEVQPPQEQTAALPEQTEKAQQATNLAEAGLAELQEVVFENAYRKGFWNDAPLLDAGEGALMAYAASKLALIHSEVSEALEELREFGAGALEPDAVRYAAGGKPEGFGSELADIIIRVLDLAGAYKISLNAIVAEKIEYNASRPAKHGKAF